MIHRLREGTAEPHVVTGSAFLCRLAPVTVQILRTPGLVRGLVEVSVTEQTAEGLTDTTEVRPSELCLQVLLVISATAAHGGSRTLPAPALGEMRDDPLGEGALLERIAQAVGPSGDLIPTTPWKHHLSRLVFALVLARPGPADTRGVRLLRCLLQSATVSNAKIHAVAVRFVPCILHQIAQSGPEAVNQAREALSQAFADPDWLRNFLQTMVTNRRRPAEASRSLSGVGDSLLLVLGGGFGSGKYGVGNGSAANFEWSSGRFFRAVHAFGLSKEAEEGLARELKALAGGEEGDRGEAANGPAEITHGAQCVLAEIFGGTLRATRSHADASGMWEVWGPILAQAPNGGDSTTVWETGVSYGLKGRRGRGDMEWLLSALRREGGNAASGAVVQKKYLGLLIVAMSQELSTNQAVDIQAPSYSVYTVFTPPFRPPSLGTACCSHACLLMNGRRFSALHPSSTAMNPS